MGSDERGRFEDYDRLSIPAAGDVTQYDGGFRSPENPVLPFANGVDEALVSAARHVLDAAAERMGRNIHWLRIYVGEAARARYDDPLPADTVRALRQFRLGLVGTPASPREAAVRLESELNRRVGLTAAIEQRSRLDWIPSSLPTGRDVDLTVVRDVTEDAAAGIEYPPASADTHRLQELLQSSNGDSDRIPTGPTGYGIRPFSATATHSLVDTAMDYALDRDRHTLTIVHQGDRLPDTEGSFRQWALSHLADEYGDVILDEQTFRDEFDGGYPADEIVVMERRTDELCRDLLTGPDEYDVIVAPSSGGLYISAIAAEAIGGVGVAPRVAIGDGRLIATPHLADQEDGDGSGNPIGLLRSGCLLFEYIGWDDAAAVVRSAVTATVTDGLLPRDCYRRSGRGTPLTTAEFADAVVERVSLVDPEYGSGGVHTTTADRAEIRRTIAGVYNIVFEDYLSPDDIELNQLLGEDEEADVYLPEVGLNFQYWRRWSPERRLEVLLHELAHVDEEDGERDHGDEFYDRLVELAEIAAEWNPELDALFGEPIDMARVQRFILGSVHEETIESDVDTVRRRRRMLRERFDIDPDTLN